jgi:hypothetical protein
MKAPSIIPFLVAGIVKIAGAGNNLRGFRWCFPLDGDPIIFGVTGALR